MKLTDISEIKRLCEKYGFTFSKDFGQNFLISEKAVSRIASCAVRTCSNVLEIGPGFGTLTRELALKAERTAALELDSRLFPVLSETLDGTGAGVYPGDVLKTDLCALADSVFGAGVPVAAVSNLPYCITTQAILRLLGCRRFESLTVMIQREAAKKLTCRPGEEQWCLFSAKVAFYGKTESVASVPRGCFYPAPKVDSEVIRVSLLNYGPAGEDAYMRVSEALFSSRRKTAGNTLSTAFGAEKAKTMLAAAELDPRRRGETFEPAEIMRLSAFL